jgi:hypothetical protein
MALTETYYAAVAEGEPIPEQNDWVERPEDAKTNGADIIIDSCAGLPQAEIWEITIRRIYTSRIEVEWDRD